MHELSRAGPRPTRASCKPCGGEGMAAGGYVRGVYMHGQCCRVALWVSFRIRGSGASAGAGRGALRWAVVCVCVCVQYRSMESHSIPFSPPPAADALWNARSASRSVSRSASRPVGQTCRGGKGGGGECTYLRSAEGVGMEHTSLGTTVQHGSA